MIQHLQRIFSQISLLEKTRLSDEQAGIVQTISDDLYSIKELLEGTAVVKNSVKGSVESSLFQGEAENFDEQNTGISSESVSRSVNVLVAEDDSINQLVIKKHMEKFGYKADFADNGQDAIEKLKSGNYDIVLMDMQMPVLDGYEAIQIIRKHLPGELNRIPIIAITASILSDASRKCLDAGADDYVPKPYDINDLHEKMEKWVAKNGESVNTKSVNNMNKQSNDHEGKSLIDLNYLNQLSEGDDEFSISMLSYFLENAPAVIADLKQFYAGKDWKNLRNVAHKFKPQLTFMGIKSVFNEVETIEQNAASEKNTDQIPSLIDKTEAVCIEAMKEIKRELDILLEKNQ